MIDEDTIRKALLIRRIEEKFLSLFSEGKLRGTVHTSIGQEYSALAFAGSLAPDDYVFSGHRCHGHFIASTGDWKGLMAELMAKRTGVCGGVGGSQHLHKENFFSSGIQGGSAPIATGLAWAKKLRGTNSITLVFIGDGTLGQGVLYESMNIASKWECPVLFVCEDNGYAQTTPKTLGVAGDVLMRARSFGLKTFDGDTWHPDELFLLADEAKEYVRTGRKPAFFHVQTYRLGPHSKGDDYRDNGEVNRQWERDPLTVWMKSHPAEAEGMAAGIDEEIGRALEEIELEGEMEPREYFGEAIPPGVLNWSPLPAGKGRVVEGINAFFHEAMGRDERILFLGEDVLSPYGGAFKAAVGLSDRFPSRVIPSPISEAALTGIATGLALGGMRPFLEIMFGDFVTLCVDQLLNHAAKFRDMYLRKVKCPMVLRTPMGGGKGMGPTHSQTLDKFLIGIDGITVLALNSLVDPGRVYGAVLNHDESPVVVIENKMDYGRKIGGRIPLNFQAEISSEEFPSVRIRPSGAAASVTLVTYGGMVAPVLDAAQALFVDHEVLAEIIVLIRIRPLDICEILDSVRRTSRLVVVEEGSMVGGFGSEVIASVIEELGPVFRARRVAAAALPIPTAGKLEAAVLPSTRAVVDSALECLK